MESVIAYASPKEDVPAGVDVYRYDRSDDIVPCGSAPTDLSEVPNSAAQDQACLDNLPGNNLFEKITNGIEDHTSYPNDAQSVSLKKFDYSELDSGYSIVDADDNGNLYAAASQLNGWLDRAIDTTIPQ